MSFCCEKCKADEYRISSEYRLAVNSAVFKKCRDMRRNDHLKLVCKYIIHDRDRLLSQYFCDSPILIKLDKLMNTVNVDQINKVSVLCSIIGYAGVLCPMKRKKLVICTPSGQQVIEVISLQVNESFGVLEIVHAFCNGIVETFHKFLVATLPKVMDFFLQIFPIHSLLSVSILHHSPHNHKDIHCMSAGRPFKSIPTKTLKIVFIYVSFVDINLWGVILLETKPR